MSYGERQLKRIAECGSGLCVGLDPRPDLIEGDVWDFLQKVIEETAEKAAAFKPNSAYFEAMGSPGIALLEKTLDKIPDEVPVILDVKRSDIGETQKYYAKACFETWDVDAVTLNPFLGPDSLEPFLAYEDRGVFLLAVTSNPGSSAIQRQRVGDRLVFEIVQEMAQAAKPGQAGLVLGLTNLSDEILGKVADLPLLIPGLGAQGGDLKSIAGQDRHSPILINVSRGILFSEPELSFAEKAQRYADRIADQL